MNWTELAKIWNLSDAKLQTRNYKLLFPVRGLPDAKGLYYTRNYVKPQWLYDAYTTYLPFKLPLPLDEANSVSEKEIGGEEYPKFLRGQWPTSFWTKTQCKIFTSSKGSNLRSLR